MCLWQVSLVGHSGILIEHLSVTFGGAPNSDVDDSFGWYLFLIVQSKVNDDVMHQAPALESHMDMEKFRHFMYFLLLRVLDLDFPLLYPIIKFTHVTYVPQFYQLKKYLC